jgi:hypothetical protein
MSSSLNEVLQRSLNREKEELAPQPQPQPPIQQQQQQIVKEEDVSEEALFQRGIKRKLEQDDKEVEEASERESKKSKINENTSSSSSSSELSTIHNAGTIVPKIELKEDTDKFLQQSADYENARKSNFEGAAAIFYLSQYHGMSTKAATTFINGKFYNGIVETGEIPYYVIQEMRDRHHISNEFEPTPHKMRRLEQDTIKEFGEFGTKIGEAVSDTVDTLAYPFSEFLFKPLYNKGKSLTQTALNKMVRKFYLPKDY